MDSCFSSSLFCYSDVPGSSFLNHSRREAILFLQKDFNSSFIYTFPLSHHLFFYISLRVAFVRYVTVARFRSAYPIRRRNVRGNCFSA